MQKDAYYFSHDANAQDDPKCIILIDQLGMEGYGIFWALIELLRCEKDYKLPLAIIPALASRWKSSKEKISAVVSGFELFEIQDNKFFSVRLMRSMQEYENKKLRLIEAGRKGGLSHAKAMLKPPSSIKVNKSKEKKSKENENKETTLAGNEKIFFDFHSSSFVHLNSKIEIYKQKFPAVDVEKEIKKMEAWLLSNPKNRKSNYERFIANWLSKTQDKAPMANKINFETPEERAKRMAKELEDRLCK